MTGLLKTTVSTAASQQNWARQKKGCKRRGLQWLSIWEQSREMDTKKKKKKVLQTRAFWPIRLWCFNSAWLTQERLNIWTYRPAGEQFLKDHQSIYIHQGLKPQSASGGACACIALKGHFWPWQNEHICSFRVICHQRALAKHWICSRTRRQPCADEVHDGRWKKRKKLHYNTVKVWRNKHTCFLSGSTGREWRASWFGIILFSNGLQGFI